MHRPRLFRLIKMHIQDGMQEFQYLIKWKKTPEEIEKENQEANIEIARNQFIYDVLEPLGYLDKILDIGIEPESVNLT